jgi:aspartyl-tRNA(Asn)/glutamyl-tRNA(Gln) amidotransferase subunit B
VVTKYETVIGLEVHAQLLTRSKMFCTCPADYQQAPPNSRVCPVCLGLPGTLPVINRQAVRAVIMTGLALHGEIAEQTKFDRKNYPYPDLMKGYQISQYDLPLCRGGYIEVITDDGPKRVGIERVHLEEDVAKLQHKTDPTTGETYSLVDVNRAGVPLMETVSRPDMRSADEARQYLLSLHAILQYLGVSTAQMEDGAFRCDANVSIRLMGTTELGPKVEVKNMNSFRAVHRALIYEVERQTALMEKGERIPQETRGWVEERGVTVSHRSKEKASDYRYFPEPDLPPLNIARKWVAEIEELLPELPGEKQSRYVSQYGLSAYDATLLTATPNTARYFDEAMASFPAATAAGAAKAVANWMTTELAGHLNESGAGILEQPVKPGDMADLVLLIQDGTLGSAQAKQALGAMYRTGNGARAVVEELDLAQVSDTSALAEAVTEAIAQNPKAIEDFLGGKASAQKFLVGQVMRITRGAANPSVVAEMVARELESKR